MPRVPHPIPTPIGELRASGTVPDDRNFDVSISGIPFLMRPTAETPHLRQTAEVRKEQIDQAPEAGEQSLSFWWLRSQASFHSGAGLQYLDGFGEADQVTRTRFSRSRGVDVWTPGKVMRLPGTVKQITYGGTDMHVVATQVSTGARIVYSAGTTLGWVLRDAAGVHTSGTFTRVGAQPIQSLATDGRYVYVGASDGVFIVDATTPATAEVKIYTTTNTRIVLGWVKQRLMAGIDNKLYELPTPVGAPPAALPTVTYTHPIVDWVWTDFGEGPTGILASGYLGAQSSILLLTLSSTGGTPTLTNAATAAVMPEGERVHSIFAYVGSLLGIGTNKGLRIAQFDPFYGTVTFGPLTIETSSPVLDMGGFDRFLFSGATAAIDGDSGLHRTDLGQPIDNVGRYAYATDLTPDTKGIAGAVTAVAVDHEGGLWFAVGASGLWRSDLVGTLTPVECYLETARIRFSTIEPKLFKFGNIEGDFSNTVVSVSVQTPGQPFTEKFELTGPLGDPPQFKLVEGPVKWAALRFDFGANGAANGTFEFRAYQIRALPASAVQRIIQLPLLCYDFEQDRTGLDTGYLGWSIARRKAMEAVENLGDEVTVLVRYGDIIPEAERAVIDRMNFVQVAAPSIESGHGGLLVMQLRTVA